MEHPTWMEINCQVLKHNWQQIKNKINGRLFCLPVKANSYGHGLVEIAKLAEEAKCIDYLGVSCSDEATQLRKANIKLPIQVFGAIHQGQLSSLLKSQAEITLSSKLKAQMLLDYCQKVNQKAVVHIEIETGTNRTGMRPSTALDLIQYLQQDQIKKSIEIRGIYTHLACAGDGPHQISVTNQMSEFNKVISDPIVLKMNSENPLIFHVANSGGVLFYPETYQSMQMVRPGILSYGMFDSYYQSQFFPEIKSAIALKSKISFFKVVEANSGIGYGHTYHTNKRSRIITVPIGYGDGYMRSLSHKAQVLIRGKRYPVVGTINMDQFMVDIGDDEAYVGDEVVLIGKQGDQEITIFDLANWAGTITYEIMCAFNQRIRRVYQ